MTNVFGRFTFTSRFWSDAKLSISLGIGHYAWGTTASLIVAGTHDKLLSAATWAYLIWFLFHINLCVSEFLLLSCKCFFYFSLFPGVLEIPSHGSQSGNHSYCLLCQCHILKRSSNWRWLDSRGSPKVRLWYRCYLIRCNQMHLKLRPRKCLFYF